MVKITPSNLSLNPILIPAIIRMMRNKIKIVFLDFDGTLFSHSSASIPASALKALRTLRENGIEVFLCTGRAYAEFADFDLSAIALSGRILSNGQMIFDDKDRLIFHKPIQGLLKEKIIALFEETAFPMYMVTADDIYLNAISPLVKEVQDSVTSSMPRIKKYEGEEIYMASAFFDKEEDIEKVFALKDLAEITWWHDGAVDIVPKGISKVQGIDEVLRYCGFTTEEALSIGDGYNDIEMLKHCAFSIAMGNACLEAKEAASYITEDIDQDGLYNGLKHYDLL